jgi:uncharacterized protein
MIRDRSGREKFRMNLRLGSMVLCVRRLAVTLGAAAVVGCAAPPSEKDQAAAQEGMVTRRDLEIVDCLLPGQVRQLGNKTYLTQRRPTRTTTSDCRIRGGEYVAFDRADLKSSLRIWMEAAEAGDLEAQNSVGEIYERGLGTEPNYEAAVIWYQKAADKGHGPALFNLGTMYEQGKGVAPDKLKALNLYRQAWGLPEDSVIYESAARREQDELRAQLERQLTEKDKQLQLLQKQLKDVESKFRKQAATQPATQPVNAEATAEIAALKAWIANLEGERRVSTERLATLPKLRTPQDLQSSAQQSPAADARTVGKLNFGRFYALVIGNQHYASMQHLQTPLRDAERAAKVLTEKYGFTVRVLSDANDVSMLGAINDLNAVLQPGDNVLIYYAGHGTRLQSGQTESGYWLPVNAEPPPKDTYWVPNEQITGHLGRLKAKRVLVVADSCYAGLLSTDPSYMFFDGKVGYTEDYLTYKLAKRSRMLLSSGGDQPVLDTGGGVHSVFARAFLDELESNQQILSTPELFSRLQKRVQASAAKNKFVQTPQFKSIKGAGHELGDFFFVPTVIKKG